MTSLESSPDSLEARLLKVKRTIQKATKDALKNASAVEPGALDRDDPNASFNLGMELFGQEVTLVEESIQEKLSSLEEELQKILKELAAADDSKTPILQNDNENEMHRTPQEIQRESDQLVVKISFLRECSSARSSLDQSITLSTPSLSPNQEPNLQKAAALQVQAQQALRRAHDILTANPASSSSPALAAAHTILDSIRSAVRQQMVELLRQARSTWQTTVSLSDHTIAVRTATGDLATAYDVLESFAEDGHAALQDLLRKLARDLHELIFQPLLQAHLDGKRLEPLVVNEIVDEKNSSVKQFATKSALRRLEWSREEQDSLDGDEKAKITQNPTKTWKETALFLERVLVFTTKNILLDRPDLCRFVGKILFGKPEATPPKALNLEALGLDTYRLPHDNGVLRDALLETLEATSLPTYLGPNDLKDLSSVAKEFDAILSPLLQALSSNYLMDESAGGRLSSFASSFEQLYVDKRRSSILNDARQMLLSNDYHNTVEVGVDARPNAEDERLGLVDGLSVFKLHQSSISDTANRLMKLCRTTMEEAVSQNPVEQSSALALLPQTLYRTARELLDLFRAIIPVTHGHEIANVPRTAAVLHNDCVFFAHHCLTLGLEYREKFAKGDQEDSAASMLRQTCIFVDMVPAFRDLAERSMGDMLDLQAKQIVELVGERIVLLGKSLRSDEVLAEWSEAETAIAAGLYHLGHLTKAWRPVLSYDVLNRSIGFLADILFSLLLDQIAEASDISTNACQFVNTQFEKVSTDFHELVDGDKSGSRLWDRFSAVGRFMDMSLADIQVALSDGVFRSVSGQELSKLVVACFTDSPKRQDLLRLLATSQA